MLSLPKVTATRTIKSTPESTVDTKNAAVTNETTLPKRASKDAA